MKKLKSFLRNDWYSIVAILFGILASFIVFGEIVDKPKDTYDEATKMVKENDVNSIKDIQFVAIGDSLTVGMGDTVSGGSGYVGRLANQLKLTYGESKVNYQNLGVNGARTYDTKERILDQVEIQDFLKEANLITVTLGTNDFATFVRYTMPEAESIGDLEEGYQEYKENFKALHDTIRKYNLEAPIYYMGIYNPFPEMYEQVGGMQAAVNKWNDITRQIVKEEKNSYFVPIAVESENYTKEEFLWKEDMYHPSSLGYQIMAQAFVGKIEETFSK